MAAKATSDVLRVTVRIPKGLLKQVKDFQFSHRLDHRAEALRQLIEMGLEANSPGSGPHSATTRAQATMSFSSRPRTS